MVPKMSFQAWWFMRYWTLELMVLFLLGLLLFETAAFFLCRGNSHHPCWKHRPQSCIVIPKNEECKSPFPRVQGVANTSRDLTVLTSPNPPLPSTRALFVSVSSLFSYITSMTTRLPNAFPSAEWMKGLEYKLNTKGKLLPLRP
ncbi:uncharacterized protein LOC144264281 [Eretmochelys imbricata]